MDAHIFGVIPRPFISVVVPVYNEEGNIRPFLRRITQALGKVGTYEIIFCLDPCSDRTEEVIEEEIKRNPSVGMLVFSRRFGQPAATMAGIRRCNGEVCVVIDADLQDPPELIPVMYEKLQSGYDVVYAKRRSRKGETMAKLILSHIGYRVINAVSDVEIPRDTGDFRMMTRRVVEELKKLGESHGFLRGLVGFVGFSHASVEYDRRERLSGSGHYNRFMGSLKIGLNGLVGFSNFLLSISLIAGLVVASASFLLIIYIAVSKFYMKLAYPMGVPTIISLILFIGGVQLVSVGILGEYIGRIYDEVKRRPKYIVDREVNLKKKLSPLNKVRL
ncbi:MAG: glycosyltransferase family 2 protein [Deltaproteobacteria bacterium]|nr:glycosyltransferase family 2 protein [Deltaproteobacteria bacterium]